MYPNGTNQVKRTESILEITRRRINPIPA